MTDWGINDDSLCGKKNNYRNSWDAIKTKRGQSEFSEDRLNKCKGFSCMQNTEI